MQAIIFKNLGSKLARYNAYEATILSYDEFSLKYQENKSEKGTQDARI